MRSGENTRGLDVSLRVARKYDHFVAGVGFDRIDVSILRIDVDAIVELDIRLRPRNDSFGFGKRRVGWRVIQPVEDAKSPIVVVHEDHFVIAGIDRHGAVNRIFIANRANRWSSNDAGFPRLRRPRVNGTVSKRGKQVRVGAYCRCRWWTPVWARREILDGNQLGITCRLTAAGPFKQR